MISRVYLRNWRSHKETEVTFSDGVNVLVGEMGAGKSSVLDGITYGLYGTLPALKSRDITLEDLLRRTPTQAEEAVVEVDFIIDGTTYTVRREVKRTSNGAKTDTAELRADEDLVEAPQSSEVTAEVTALLGVNYDLFTRAIYAEQNQLDQFLTLRAGERKEKVDELLELDRFEDARQTLVTVTNRIKDRRQSREDELERLQDDIDDAAIDELEDAQNQAQEELADLQEQRNELDADLEDVTETLEELAEKEERYEALENKQTALETRIEALEEQITDISDDADPDATASPEAAAERREELEDELAELEEQQETINDLEQDLSVLADRRERLEDALEELEEQQAALEELDDIQDELDEQTEQLEALKERKQTIVTKQEEIRETLQELSTAADTCPTCGQELSEKHRVDVLQEKKAEKEELADELEAVTDDINELTEMIDELQEQRDELLQYQDVDEEIDETTDELDDVQEEIDEKQERLEELEEAYSEDRQEQLEEQLDAVEAAEELLELEEKRETREDELDEVTDELDDLSFDPDALDDTREQVTELEKEIEVLETEIENKQEMIEERAKRLEELEQQQERIDQCEEDIDTYREKEDLLHEMLQALEQTQVQLREEFVDAVNDVMRQVWERVYPYDDYRTIRLNAESGYAVELEDENGDWISVNGEVSGGERHSAALTLRIALSILLAPAWKILILDEPTHNLDVTAIEELADTLRTTVTDMVDQLFLITHEERLETAATGDLYHLSKQSAETGLTEIETLTGE